MIEAIARDESVRCSVFASIRPGSCPFAWDSAHYALLVNYVSVAVNILRDAIHVYAAALPVL